MSDAVARSDALDDEWSSIAASIDTLAKASRRNRRLLKWLGASVAFDILLSGALGLVAFRQREVTHQLKAQSTTITQTCEESNRARAVNLQLWLHILDTPPSTPRTAQQQEAADDFRAFVTNTFASRDCTRAE